MKKKLLIGGGAVATAAIAAAVAFAAPGQMSKADTNGDGSLSKLEVTAMANTPFTKMDVNADGQINAADREAKQKAKFGEIDTDKNGSISEAEFTAAHAARMAERGERGEGKMRGHREGRGHHGMGKGHHGGGMKMLKMADANGDKTITKAEMTAAVDAHFAKADSNKDGQISSAEHDAMRSAMRERMKAAATN